MAEGNEGTQEMLERLRNRPIENPWPVEVNWAIVAHRLQYSAANHKQCECETCVPYMRMIHEKFWKEQP